MSYLCRTEVQAEILNRLCEEVGQKLVHPIVYTWSWLTSKQTAMVFTPTPILNEVQDGVQIDLLLAPQDGQANGSWIAGFSLKQFPGNDHLFVSFGQVVQYRKRGQGIGTSMTKYKEQLVQSWGGNAMIATVRYDNTPEMKIINGLDWKPTGLMVGDAGLFYRNLDWD